MTSLLVAWDFRCFASALMNKSDFDWLSVFFFAVRIGTASGIGDGVPSDVGSCSSMLCFLYFPPRLHAPNVSKPIPQVLE